MTEPAYLAAIRESYDTVADAYLDIIENLDGLAPPADLGLIQEFAKLVLASGAGPVADLGCGYGRLTGHLDSLGLSAFGVDLSPRMIENARKAFPGLRFEVGSMTALEIDDAGLAGILSWFSVFHLPPEILPAVFAEFRRTLIPGGHLLLGTHLGEGIVRPESAYGGLPVSYESHLQSAGRIEELLHESGFDITVRLVREPGLESKRQGGAFLARRR